ncbi:MAG TPA: tRNA (adenosine(37)-N6)-dimethylallyltransferase MiaA [Crocinitomicaceae bacterium]|nr:tRNA (adenosine(37)-N6)-dimethylallyltransferase MiaA [Crocinitomicaceae bacterium]
MKHLIVIAGPTASGKTSVSIEIAKHFKTSILSADSRQFYREISIGTAKPSTKERDGVNHFFIDSHQLTDEVSSAQYEKEALDILAKEFISKDVVVLTGGSGMFIDALCIGLDSIPSSKEVRTIIQKEFDEEGLSLLLSELKSKDPEYYSEVDQQNPMRIIRAIEAIRLSGEKYSELRKAKPEPRPFNVHRYVLQHDRKILYDRINNRVDQMIKNGLIEEARSVQDLNHLSSLNTVGYKELFDCFENKITLTEAIELIKRNSRRYAKRQITWFKRHEDAKSMEFSSIEQTSREIIQHFENQIILE